MGIASPDLYEALSGHRQLRKFMGGRTFMKRLLGLIKHQAPVPGAQVRPINYIRAGNERIQSLMDRECGTHTDVGLAVTPGICYNWLLTC